jgi:hypothetical protein
MSDGYEKFLRENGVEPKPKFPVWGWPVLATFGYAPLTPNRSNIQT